MFVALLVRMIVFLDLVRPVQLFFALGPYLSNGRIRVLNQAACAVKLSEVVGCLFLLLLVHICAVKICQEVVCTIEGRL